MNAQWNVKAGQEIYTPFTLKIYNLLVLTISNRWSWKCPTKTQLAFFDENISNIHLDVGPGSGYYMEHCQFPDPTQVQLTLMDLNQNCLNYCAKKLQRYRPQQWQRDVFQPMTDIGHSFESISLNYVLHCLPGDLDDKEIVFKHLKKLLTPKGILFGSTILGEGVQPNGLARKLLKLYNKKKIFSNERDSLEKLTQLLVKHFKQVEVQQKGLVVLFKVSEAL